MILKSWMKLNFVNNSLRALGVNKADRIFVLAGLTELYKEIVDSWEKKNQITMKDFTNFVVDKIIDISDQSTSINNKYVSKMTSSKFQTLYNSKRLIDIAPSVFGGSEEWLRRFEIDNTIHDHGRHSHGIK